ncbi:MAG: 2'-deoxycytidine 5'-triphosphate deaminase [Alphaproteobacteria bacterium]|nr:2'-deoxycytidine 5'-triphosphate deaminase [Alphaproteobacteria bacterium]
MAEAAARTERSENDTESNVTAARGTGILPSQTIRDMIRLGEISALAPIENSQIQPASIDLRLGDCAYPVATSFLPGKDTSVLEKMGQFDPNYQDYKIPLTNNNGIGALLEKGQVYVVPLMESIKLKPDHMALANPKSSTGRLDILTRLLADGATKFDEVGDCYKGNLYVEIAPRSFSIAVKAGTCLNQLRFQRARGETPRQITDDEWKRLLRDEQIVKTPQGVPVDLLGRKEISSDSRGLLPFHIDLRGSGTGNELIGWCSKVGAGRIDLARRDYDPLDFWEPIFSRKDSLVLDPNRFYILMTEEAIGVPPDYAAEMLPYDTRAGEFRVHYAGFFDPGFGWDPATKKVGNSRGVLEVRSHEIPFQLEHGQLVGWLKYERMASAPEALYGQTGLSNYQGQSLKLTKQFLPYRR